MSPFSIEPKKGVRLQLANYSKIRSFQGGGEFWETQFQQIIRQCLGDFLPRAEEDRAGSVLFQHFVNSEEVCSESDPIAGSAAVPAGELQRLERCIQTLKAKETDPLIDGNARKLIQAFRLPDPNKDSELYRLYGPRTNRKLLVLWGVEKERQSSLDPLAAISRVRERAAGGFWKKCLVPLAALLVLLLAFLIWLALEKHDRVPPTARNGTAVSATGSPSSAIAKNIPSADANAPDARRDGAPSNSTPTSSSEKATPPKMADARTGTTTAPGTNAAEALSNDSSNPNKNGAPTETQSEAGKNSRPPASGNAPAKSPASPASNPKATPPFPTADSASKSPAGTAHPPSEKPDFASAANSPALSDRLKLNIEKTSTDKMTPDGKAEVGLKARFSDKDGKSLPGGKISEWKIDGAIQRVGAKLRTEPFLTTQLKQGTHQVEVTGVGADGKSIHTSASIEIDIQSSVRLKPAP